MYVAGKILGALIGFLAGGPIVAALGAVVGHFFDQALKGLVTEDENGEFTPNNQAEAPRGVSPTEFSRTLFTMAGVLAKADGRVCEAEIMQAQHLFSHLELNATQRKQAIDWFKAGSKDDSNWQDELSALSDSMGPQSELREVFLSFLISIALADQELHVKEQVLLNQVANLLGYSDADFAKLLASVQAQQRFEQQEAGVEPGQSELDLAYQALGVSSEDSPQEIKRAYRRLMSQYHPDKLIAQGVPEAMLKMATEKAQEIQAAYDLIKKHTGKGG